MDEEAPGVDTPQGGYPSEVARKLWTKSKPRKEDQNQGGWVGTCTRGALIGGIIILGRCPRCRTWLLFFFFIGLICLLLYFIGGPSTLNPFWRRNR